MQQRVSNVAEGEALLEEIVAHLEKRAGGALLSRVGAELAHRNASAFFRPLGFARLTDFVKECPRLALTGSNGQEVVSRVRTEPAVVPTPGKKKEKRLYAVVSAPVAEAWLRAFVKQHATSDQLRSDDIFAAQAAITAEPTTVAGFLEPAIVTSIARLLDSNGTQEDRDGFAYWLWSHGEIALSNVKFILAFEFFMTAIACAQGDLPQLKPMRALQAISADVLGTLALDMTAIELQERLTPELKDLLAIATARMAIADSRLPDDVYDRAPLLYAVREHARELLRKNSMFARAISGLRPNEVEFRTFEIIGGVIAQCERDLLTTTSATLSSTGVGIDRHCKELLRTLGRHRALFFPVEHRAWKVLEPYLGRSLSTTITSSAANVVGDSETVLRQRMVLEELAMLPDHVHQDSLLARTVFAPIATHVATLARSVLADASQRRRPDLQVRHSRQRYPLNPGWSMNLHVDIMNTGTGPASDVTIAVAAPVEHVAVIGGATLIGTLLPGDEKSGTITLDVQSPLPVLRLPVQITGRDWLGATVSFQDELTIEDQGPEPDLDALFDRKLYVLEPINEAERLRGRTPHLTTLRLNIAMQTSTIMWGQKRVGKTSIGRVMFNELRERGRHHVLYIRKGDIAGLMETDLANRLGESISAEVAKAHKRPLVERQVFDHFTRFAAYLDDLRNAGCTCPIVIFFDEFDEFNEIFYRGVRGNDFFSTLRAITERDVVLVLIGGERMPAIFRRHHQQLNKFASLRVDTLADMTDALEMVTKPVEGHITYDPDAATSIANYAGRNPYYINLICSRILGGMLRARRTFVDRTDVTRACHDLASDNAILHWGHLWEDSDAEDLHERSRRQVNAATVLAAMGSHVSDHGITEEMLHAAVKGEDNRNVDVPATLAELTNRGVLHVENGPAGVEHTVTVKLFKLWLNEHGRSVLLPLARTIEPPQLGAAHLSVNTPLVPQYEFPVADDDLTALADGLTYRMKPVDAMSVKQWLRQFQDDTAILLMFRLLTELRARWYIDDARLSFALNKAYDHAVRAAGDADVEIKYVRTSRAVPAEFAFRQQYLNRDEALGRVANLFVTYFGNETKSGAQIARRLKQAKRIISVGDLRASLDWLQKPGGAVAHEHRLVIIVDDFVGSGYQFLSDAVPTIRAAMNAAPIASAVTQGRLGYYPLWAYRDGLDRIRTLLPELRCSPVHHLDECDQAFAPQAAIFDTDAERTMAQRIATHVGKQLYPDHPLGWDGLQSMVVFGEAVPNASLPIFWASGIVDERPWVPLFPR